MSALLTTVKTAIAAATEEFHRQMADTPDMVLALTSAGKTLPEMRARAAIKATLEHLSDHVSAKALSANPGTSTCDDVTFYRAKLKAILSQALSEIED